MDCGLDAGIKPAATSLPLDFSKLDHYQRSAISLAIVPELLAEPQGGKYRFIQAIEPDWIEAIISEMSSQTARDQVIEALQDLHPEATLEDAIDRLVFVARMDAGLAELDASDSSPESACQNPSQPLPPLSPSLR